MLEFKTMRIVCIALAMALMLWIAVPAATAHHSAAGQDFTKRVEVEGVVQLWEIVNPHGRVVLRVTDAKGTRDIHFETHSRNNVYRSGYRDGMVKAGDKIKVMIAPNRNGSDGGYIASFVTASGAKVGGGN
jgi:hypothetical protein